MDTEKYTSRTSTLTLTVHFVSRKELIANIVRMSIASPSPQVEGEIAEDVVVADESPIDEQTQENYRVWKKNAPFLYDYISTTSLLWPSLSVQFFPDLEGKSSGSNVDSLGQASGSTASDEVGVAYHRLLIGTFTLGQAKVDNVSILRLPYYTDLNKKIDINKLNYTQEKGEFELSTVTKKKVQVLQKINHLGDVNKVKYMPQNPDLIASSNNMGDLVVYDRTKHPNFKIGIDDSGVNKPELRLRPNESGGAKVSATDIFAIDWNTQKQGTIASGSMDGSINIYDIRKDFQSKDQDSILSSKFYENISAGPGDTSGPAGVNDLEWVAKHDSIFSTVDEAGWLKLYDTRADALVSSYKISDEGINSVRMNPGSQSYIATGDSAGVIKILDIRTGNTVEELQSGSAFTDSITQLKWHHKHHNILAGSSTDKTVKIFDLSKVSNEKSDGNDGVLFVHGGHMLGVNDFDWCLHDDWLISSVADDNSLHVWKPSSKVVKEYSSK